MASFTLCCCVIALPILVLGYKQDWRADEGIDNTATLSKRSIQKSERGWIGCVYNPEVCEEDEECVNDNLFGICQSQSSIERGSQFLYDYKDLSHDWKRLLEKELIKLASEGYRWTDVYTQCILRSTLLSYRSASYHDAALCRASKKYEPGDRDIEELEIKSRPGSLLANEATSSDRLAQILAGAEAEKRDAAVKLHKYFDREAQLSPSDDDLGGDYEGQPDNGQDVIDDEDLSKLRKQLLQLKSVQDDVQESLDSDSVRDLKDSELNKLKEKPENDDLSLVATLMKKGVGSEERPKRTDELMGHAQMKSSAENMSPEEALSNLRPSKRFPDAHVDEHPEGDAARMRKLARQEALEAQLAAVTSKPKKVVDSRWVFLAIGWPKNGKQGFDTRSQVAEFLDALQEKMGLPELYDKFQYRNSEIDFHLTTPLQENPQSIVELLKNITQPIANGPLILGSGLGREKQKVSAARLTPKPKHFGVTFAVCGAVLFIIIAVIIVFFMQRYRISKSKVYSLTKAAEQGESREAYQDLCRSRMQSRNSEKPEPVSAAARAVGPALTRGDSNSAGSTRSSTSSWSEEPIHSNMDISTGHLILSYMEEHLNNKEKLESEWNNLCAYQPDVVKCDVGKREENLNRNRYLDNIPYDNNRVELKTAVDGSNYFNASYVINHDPKNPVYIVTQGPLSNTVAQFWQMIWEQGSIVIVNLTRLVEDGISLCQKYWPEEGSELYNNYEVHLVSEHVWCEDYLVRSFYLKNVSTGETRTVTQFHFLSWPDLGEPSAVKTLLDFRRKVNKSYKGRSCPVVVHCSDGCGRSGTYILLDMVLNRLAKGVKEIDISAAVEHLRDQRCQMVKTKGQFEFVLTAIAEEVHAMLKSLPQ